MHVEKRTGREGGRGKGEENRGSDGGKAFFSRKVRGGEAGRRVRERTIEERGAAGRKARKRTIEERGAVGRKARERTIEERGNGRSKSAGTDVRRARARTVEERGGGRPVEECGGNRSRSEGQPVKKRGDGRSKSEGIQKRVGVGGGNTGPCGWRLTTSRSRVRARPTV